MFDYFISSIPLWVWITLVALIAGLLFYFFSPVILGIWRLMPNWLRITLGAIFAALGIYAAGRHKGYKDVKAREDELNKKAAENRRKIHEDVQKLNPTDTDKRLNKWMRD